jgi:hypothetical protein
MQLQSDLEALDLSELKQADRILSANDGAAISDIQTLTNRVFFMLVLFCGVANSI